MACLAYSSPARKNLMTTASCLTPFSKHFAFTLLLFSLIIPASTFATISANTSQSIPDDLKQWQSWVLKDDLSQQCPITYNSDDHLCAYPDELSIELAKNTGHFEQTWVVYARSWITLPGDHKIWPRNVRINQKPVPVVSFNNLPSIELQKGRYIISGEFSWQERPKSLAIPEKTALIKLRIDNKAIALPDFRNARLWLKTTTRKAHQNNKLDLKVYRKITDSIPLNLTTQLQLNVSGQQREIILEGALLKGFIPGAISSDLPAQIDRQGRLKLQIRPGQWIINITSFHPRLLESIALPAFKAPWPEQETWALEQQPHLRLIKVLDKNSIDPDQTQLPPSWKTFPAYNLKSGERLQFEILKRGDPEPEPDQLSLSKKLWLDFNGNGFTVNDKITGKLSRQWRLNASDQNLGQVSLNGKPQFITRNDSQQQGVEVRHGDLDLSADSRIDTRSRTLSASGWDMDFTQVSTSLYLPAGWRLMSVSGASSDETWLKQWTLLDLFIVLITSIAIFKIFGLKWGAIALITLSLSWHEYDSPRYIWLNLIIAITLLRVLPQGRLYSLMNNYRIVISVFLLIIILPFIVDQVRTTLHPQLEFQNMSVGNSYRSSSISAEQVLSYAMQGEPAAVAEEDAMYSGIDVEAPGVARQLYSRRSAPESRMKLYPAKEELAAIDPDAMIQTGPGLPSWTLHEHYLTWDGPVQKDQKISMILLSPEMHGALKIIQLIFILLLSWRLLGISAFKLPSPAQLITGSRSASITFAALLMGVLFNTLPSPAQAAFPAPELLDELRQQLTKSADCLPECASIESMTIELSAQQLKISLRIHAQENILLPLPVPIKQWIPGKISIDGKNTSGLIRKDDSTLWLHSTKGTHRVTISGRVEHINQLQFSFPLKPHYIDVKNNGWTSEGMDREAHKITALSFIRIVDKSKSTTNSEIEQSELPVYAEVSRTLVLGIDWKITTQVRGLSGSAYPIILNIPLLKGESVITDNIKVKDQQAVITLNNNHSTASWTSRLENNSQINLHASEQGQFIERWTLHSSPIWHISFDGTPVIYHQRLANNWQPEWQPWPGENLSIHVSRPEGIKGRTLTIDSSTLTLTPGEQITAASLSFNLRSSLGGQHLIQLPENAELQSVKINDQSVPVRNMKDGLPLSVSPGNQHIEIDWNEPRGISGLYQSSSVNLGVESVNNQISITPGYSRWVLFTSGPSIGPAVLFWGVFIVILIISTALGRIKETPLNALQWLLLGAGLSASGPWGLMVIASCIFALRTRGKLNTAELSRPLFNFMQTMLVMLILISVGTLLYVIQQGLLGSADMQITGNGSSAYQLNWFSDRIDTALPHASIISVPAYAYRLLMLAWSIWLAFSVIKWAQWGWSNFTETEYWRSKKPVVKVDKEPGNEQK